MAEITLNSFSVGERLVVGQISAEVTDEQELKVETSPGGEELLIITAPSGETWEAHINVDFIRLS